MERLFSRWMPDWSDRAAVAEYAAAGAEILGDDPAAARPTAERKWDRTPSTEPVVQAQLARWGTQPVEACIGRADVAVHGAYLAAPNVAFRNLAGAPEPVARSRPRLLRELGGDTDELELHAPARK